SLILLMMPHPPTSLLFPSTTLFRSDAGRVLFYLQCAECRFEMPETVRIESKGGALEPLTHDDGGQLERSLFDFVHRGEYNDYERQVALVLDRDVNVLWWYRDRGGHGSSTIQGFPRARIHPHFGAQGTSD